MIYLFKNIVRNDVKDNQQLRFGSTNFVKPLNDEFARAYLLSFVMSKTHVCLLIVLCSSNNSFTLMYKILHFDGTYLNLTIQFYEKKERIEGVLKAKNVFSPPFQ